ncbi:MFS transporter, DHA1 family, inner membrane transport protein [Ectopseudomonas toyotomiensis]|uniref:MFS transporter, DHA1 family, inner membrane transport protein n=2 Tax=Ectopseudomonas toyotomiensis TaxID=554344 RepID=A0A1I5Z154_9GAMM|nr:MFS transporter, DHA1 family, inner membrane transport protein [Pseudomonas toyotomiensis]
MSLLPGLAESTGVSIPTAGSYISAYALGVVVGAPLIAILAARSSRKALLIALIALFAIGYATSAVAWDHSSLLGARFLAGLPHGAYYGVACLVAAAMVGEGRKAQAAGYVMAGLAAANVIGVPAATWIGQTFGWRTAFGSLAVAGIATMLLFWLYVPSVPRDPNASPKAEMSGLKRPLIWLTLATASIGFGGMFAVYSYITPTLTEVTGFSINQVPRVLAFWGVGMIVGNLVGGWLADRGLVRAIFAIMVWNVVFLALFSLFAPSKVGTLAVLFLVGCGFALVPALQVRLMNVAGDAQTLAAALNHSAFNISNAVGASLGGMSIAMGLGWSSTGGVGALLALLGIAVMAISVMVERSARTTLQAK